MVNIINFERTNGLIYIQPNQKVWLMLPFAFCYQIWFDQSNHIKVDIETFQFLELSQITLLQFDKTVWTKSLSHDYQWRKWRSFSSNSIWTWKSVFWRSNFFCQEKKTDVLIQFFIFVKRKKWDNEPLLPNKQKKKN